MIYSEYGKHCHLYDEIFERIPRGKENAISLLELSQVLNYHYSIHPCEEALRVITCMLADGYIIIGDNGKFYRVSHFYELREIYGDRFAEDADLSNYWII